MVNKTINEFNALTSVAEDDYVLLWDTSTNSTVKMSATNLVSSNLITSDKIPSLDASKITTGTLSSSSMVPNLDASKITTGTLSSSSMIPNIDMSLVTTGSIVASRVTVSDNSSADTSYIPLVLYNTDETPPTASNFPIGTIYIQYTS